MKQKQAHSSKNRDFRSGLLTLIALASILLCIAVSHLESSDVPQGVISELISMITLN